MTNWSRFSKTIEVAGAAGNEVPALPAPFFCGQRDWFDHHWRASVSVRLFEGVGEEGEDLFFAGDDVAHLVDAGLEAGVVDGFDEVLVARDEEEGALGGDVGDEEGGEIVGALGAVDFEGFEEFGFAFPELVEADLLNLGDAEGDAVFAIFLAIGGDGLGRGFEGEEGAGGEQFVGEFAGVDLGEDFEFFQDLGIARGGGGRGEIQGVGHDAGEEESGDGAGQFDIVTEEAVGDDGAGGADGFVPEQDGLLGGKGTDAMVVDDLDDLDFFGTLNGLGKFVVVDEDELAVDGLEEVGLGQDADGLAAGVEHGENKIAGGGGFVANGGEGGVFAEAEEFLVQDVADGDGGAAEGGGGGGVVGAGDDADVFLLGGLDGLGFDGDAAGDDEDADAFADGDVLDIPAVADDDGEFFRGIAVEAVGEGFEAHGADHEDEILFAVDIEAGDDLAIEGLGEAVDGGEDLAGMMGVLGGGEKELAELEQGEQALAFLVLVEDGEDAEVFLVHQAEGFDGGGIGTHTEDAALHDVGDLGGDVRDEDGGGDAKGVQDKIDALVGVAAAGGDGFVHAGAAFEFGIADGGADGIRIRVAMTDYQDFTHLTKLTGKEANHPVRRRQDLRGFFDIGDTVCERAGGIERIYFGLIT